MEKHKVLRDFNDELYGVPYKAGDLFPMEGHHFHPDKVKKLEGAGFIEKAKEAAKKE